MTGKGFIGCFAEAGCAIQVTRHLAGGVPSEVVRACLSAPNWKAVPTATVSGPYRVSWMVGTGSPEVSGKKLNPNILMIVVTKLMSRSNSLGSTER